MIASSGSLPWFLPLSVLALVLSVPASGPVARWLGTSRGVAWVMVLSLGVILAATLSPFAGVGPAPGCDLSRVGLVPLGELLWSGDLLGNVLGFVPLGFALALVPRSRRKAAVLIGAIALPFLVEATQLIVLPLGRACQVSDVIDNLTGLVIGLAAGTVVSWLAIRRRRPAA